MTSLFFYPFWLKLFNLLDCSNLCWTFIILTFLIEFEYNSIGGFMAFYFFFAGNISTLCSTWERTPILLSSLWQSFTGFGGFSFWLIKAHQFYFPLPIQQSDLNSLKKKNGTVFKVCSCRFRIQYYWWKKLVWQVEKVSWIDLVLNVSWLTDSWLEGSFSVSNM